MGILLFILLIIFGMLFGNLSQHALGNSKVSNLLTFILVFIVSALVTYTPDWGGYQTWIDEDLGRDVFFNFFVKTVLPDGWGYQFVHIFFISTYTIILIYLISRFTTQTYLVMVLYIGIVYLFYTTQIRFFLGYYTMSLAFYLLFVESRKRYAILALVFAVLNHITLLFFLPFMYFFFIKVETLIKRFFLLVILMVLFYVLSTVFLTENTGNLVFLTYITSDTFESTILGGLFSFLPIIVGFVLVNLYAREKIAEFPALLEDKKFQYLYRFVVISIMFVGVALERQVIGQRFVIPSAIFQMLMLFYLANYNERRQNAQLAVVGGIFYIFFFFYNYVLSMMITSSNISTVVGDMLRSNMVIKYFFIN